MSKHTPGPWRWWPCKETESAFNDYAQIAAGLKDVAQVKLSSVTKHDMRLIAAAPELLEALKDMLDGHEDACTGYGEGAADKARAAIAKATGGEA